MMPAPFKRPRKDPESLLFHPKKKIGGNISTAARPSSHLRPNPSPPKVAVVKPKPVLDADEEALKLPTGNYQEFRLVSSALNGWKYDVMKFDSRKTIDISTWQAPIKLNRKELKRDDRGASASFGAVPVKPMLGADGKPVIGPDGKVVMVDALGRPIHSSGSNEEASGSGLGRDKGKGPANGKKKFQKKTRQVFLMPESTRQLRKEERHPWIMEDASGKEVWVGKLEDLSKSETHAFFMPAANDVFKFVPAHRWYKFQKKPNYHIPNLEEAESMMAKWQRNKDPERWLLYNRNGRAPSSATAAVLKAEAEGRIPIQGSSHVHTASRSLGPGGRRLRTVDKGMGALFGDDDDEDVKPKLRRDEAEGDIDEMVFEEDFDDDDEKVEEDNEEAKETEERLKREYKVANKQRDGRVVESDEEEEHSQLTKDGKAIKKLIRNLEKNAAYESDEERNPYASSQEEEEDEKDEAPVPAVPTATPAEPASSKPSQPPSRSGSQAPPSLPKATASRPSTQPGSRAVSRPSSPAPTSPVSPSLGGHSVVAKRATSPKAPKPVPNGMGLGGGQGSRATSPKPNGLVSSRQGSPFTQKPVTKRKASEDSSAMGAGVSPAVAPRPKKRKSQGGLGLTVAPTEELDDKVVIDWLKSKLNPTTRDCIQHFTPYLTDEVKKGKFTALVKEVAILKGGVLVLKNAYRGDSAAGSPAPIAA